MTAWFYKARLVLRFFGVSFVDELILVSLNHEIWVSEIRNKNWSIDFHAVGFFVVVEINLLPQYNT